MQENINTYQDKNLYIAINEGQLSAYCWAVTGEEALQILKDQGVVFISVGNQLVADEKLHVTQHCGNNMS
jgi:predicted secreted protein